MLALEVEFLTGAYRASLGERGGEWPPHPERLFSALVQAWVDGGSEPGERSALEWLESQDAPLIEASAEFEERDAPVVFVPPNDSRGHEPSILPWSRRRQERRFRATIPTYPVVRFFWPVEADGEIRPLLARLASRVASLGHSTSLVRCSALEPTEPGADVWKPQENGPVALRIPYAGRIRDLERWYEQGQWPDSLSDKRYLPPGPPVVESAPTRSVFGAYGDWFVFEDVGGVKPDLVGFPVVARRLRHALMSLGDQPPSTLLSGHQADGAPARATHAAIVPLANVGWEHSTGDLLGFAVVLPRETDLAEREAVLRALGRFVRLADDREDRSEARLEVVPGKPWILERSPLPAKASLSPDRYCRPSSVWASVTPVFLDRFPGKGDATEEASIVAAACVNIGLPEPLQVELHKHAAIKGAPSAYPAGRRGSDWAMPTKASFRNRPRRHVVLRFGTPVSGPVIIGAARYHGLGLCLPVDEAGP